MTIMTNEDKGLTYTPGDLANAPRKWQPRPMRIDLTESGRRDKAWRSLRKMVQAGRSDRQLDRAARLLG